MTNNSTSQVLSASAESTIRTAAHGAVTLMAYAGVAGSPGKVATDGSLALASATGLVGHVLAKKTKDVTLDYKSGAALADQVLPALAESVALLEAHDAAEAANFRSTVVVAVEAAAGPGEPTPPVAAMISKIKTALNA